MSGSSLEELRKQLTELSMTFWEKYLKAMPTGLTTDVLEDEAASGQFVHMPGVDISQQCESGSERFVVHKDDKGDLWAFPMKTAWNALVKMIRDGENEFGWGRENVWDVVAIELGTRSIYDHWANRWQDDVPLLAVRAIRVPDQFCVFLHPEHGPRIPGMQQASERLQAQQASVSAPRINSPKELIGVLLDTLKRADQHRFQQLWVEGTSERDLRYSYEQYRKAFIASDGRLTFERYDPNMSPDADEKCEKAKMFVKRENKEGPPVSRPLTLHLEGDGWRIKSGII